MSNLYNNYKLYEHTNHILKDSIENDDNIIILFGNGGNGKSYLTQEMNSILSKNNYNIFNPVETYEWDDTSFKNHLSFCPNKICLFPPPPREAPPESWGAQLQRLPQIYETEMREFQVLETWDAQLQGLPQF